MLEWHFSQPHVSENKRRHTGLFKKTNKTNGKVIQMKRDGIYSYLASATVSHKLI